MRKGGQLMTPEIVLNQKMMPSLEAALERDYAVHRIDGRSELGALPVRSAGGSARSSPVAAPAPRPSWWRRCRRSRSLRSTG